MSIPTKLSLSGFFASAPKRSVTEKQVTRMFAYIGKRISEPQTEGMPSTETSLYELVAFGAAAEAALRKFARGDNFIAEGRVQEYQRDVEGEPVTVQQFVATKIGHDAARNTYEVDRSKRVKRATERSNRISKNSPAPMVARAV